MTTWYLKATVSDGTLHWTGTGWTGPKRFAYRYTFRSQAVLEARRQRQLDWPVVIVRVNSPPKRSTERG